MNDSTAPHRALNHSDERGTAVTSVQEWAKRQRVFRPLSRSAPIVSALREGIIMGEIDSGQQLKQDELSTHFGVSPAPVREALRQLESEGLVRHYPNRGAFVSDVPADEAVGVLFPTRLLLESYAWERVRRDLNADLIDMFDEQIEVMQRGADLQDVAIINEADVRFHEIAMEASRAYHTIQLWRSVLPRIRLQLYRLTPHHRNLQDIPAEHRILLSALRQDDPARFAEVLHEHIVGVAHSLLDRADTLVAQPRNTNESNTNETDGISY